MSDTALTATPAQSTADIEQLLSTLREFRREFSTVADSYDGSPADADALEQAMAEYAQLVTDERHGETYAAAVASATPDFVALVDDLRTVSARCAAIAEKHRARRLLSGHPGSAAYFDNVEACIEAELGPYPPTADSKVLLVGSGSYPMTLLQLARRTGARVVGLDIDAEAISLGRRVIETLGPDLPISVEHLAIEDLPFTGEATHVIFSSTISVKYELLDQLHALTSDEVIVAMRFGDGLKSLFNYPSSPVDPDKWKQTLTLRQPEAVFDVALHRKAHVVVPDGMP